MPTTVLLDTTDLSEAEAVLSAYCTAPKLTASHASRTRMARTTVGSMSIDELEFGCDVSYTLDSLTDIGVVRLRRGGFTHHQPSGFEGALGPGDVEATGLSDGQPMSGQLLSTQHIVVNFDRTLLSTVAESGPQPGHSLQPVRLLAPNPISPEANKILVKTIDYIVGIAAAHPAVSDNELLAGAVQRYLAGVMLTAFPNTALFEPTIEDRHDSTPALLRKAIAFIDDNAHRDISVVDIAGSIYVTPRTLQYMFRKHRDCTPMEYLRRVRLHYAHLDLMASNRMTTTVATIATRWGFGHLGRFAVYYRQSYGRTPHDTLRGG